MMMSKKTAITLLTTIGASLSCYASKLSSSFAFVQSYCPLFVLIAALVLLYVWWEKLQPNRVAEITCCPVSSFLASKKFLTIVTISFIGIVTLSKI